MNPAHGSGAAPPSAVSPGQAQREVNTRIWAAGGFLRRYRGQGLRPAESLLFARHGGALGGRVLELGCGGGRLTGHLIAHATSVHGVDIAADMVAYCRRTYPEATFSEGDLRELFGWEGADWDVVVAGWAVIDVLNEDDRCSFLDQIHRLLRANGLLIFSSHNLACAPLLKGPLRSISATNPVSFASQVLRLPRSLRNRRRLVSWQRVEDDYAILNGAAHDFSLLHHYITRDGQERELARHGFALVECVDADGKTVAPGEQAVSHHELHYVATRCERGPRDPSSGGGRSG